MSLTSTPKEVDSSRIWLGGLVTIVLSVIGNLILLWIANLLVEIPPEFAPLGPLRISIFTVVFLLGAIIVYAILAAKADHPIRTYQRIGWIFLIVSFIPDIAIFFVYFKCKREFSLIKPLSHRSKCLLHLRLLVLLHRLAIQVLCQTDESLPTHFC